MCASAAPAYVPALKLQEDGGRHASRRSCYVWPGDKLRPGSALARCSIASVTAGVTRHKADRKTSSLSVKGYELLFIVPDEVALAFAQDDVPFCFEPPPHSGNAARIFGIELTAIFQHAPIGRNGL